MGETVQSETALDTQAIRNWNWNWDSALGRTLQLSRKANVCKFRIHFATNTKIQLHRGEGERNTHTHAFIISHIIIYTLCLSARWFRRCCRCCCYLCSFLVHKTADICCFQFRTLRPQKTTFVQLSHCAPVSQCPTVPLYYVCLLSYSSAQLKFRLSSALD